MVNVTTWWMPVFLSQLTKMRFPDEIRNAVGVALPILVVFIPFFIDVVARRSFMVMVRLGTIP